MKHLASLLLSALLAACSNSTPNPTPPGILNASSADSRIAPGDTIRVAFSSSPEIDGTHKIQPDGQVSLPHLGATPAAGLTLSQLQSRLNQLYQPWLQDPGVVVTMQNAAAGVYVGGEVIRPGKIPLDRPMTALQAVMEAGGFTRLANPRNVVLVRQHHGQESRQALNLNQSLHTSNSQAVFLRPYDVLYVHPSFW